jgi:hypothetical protein
MNTFSTPTTRVKEAVSTFREVVLKASLGVEMLFYCNSVSSMKIPGFKKNLHMEKIQETKHLYIRPVFGHFWENSTKILAQICTAADICSRSLLSYAAKETAICERCTVK